MWEGSTPACAHSDGGPRSGELVDEGDQLVDAVSVMTREGDEFPRLLDDGALGRRAGDRDAAAAAELEQAFFSEQPQRPQHGVRVDPEHGGEVLRGREPLTRLGLALGDRAPDLRGDLFVEVGRFGSIDLDRNHDASNNSTKVEGAPMID